MMFNKNVRRGISIFLLLLLTLYMGLCLEAAALEEMEVGGLHEFGWGYSVMMVGADIKEGTAQFWLLKEGKEIDNTTVRSGERFSLDDGENFHFEATFGPVFRSDNTIMVRLTDYKWYKLMAVGDLHELGWGYSIEVVEANDKEGKALFRLYKEGETIKDMTVIFGEWFSLDDGENFHFEATMGPVSRSDDKIMVRLMDSSYWYNEPSLYPYLLPIIGVVTIVLIFSIVIIRLRARIEIGIEKLIEKIRPRPVLSVNRRTSEISITEGEELDVKIELKNEGKDVAKSVSLSDRFPDGFEIILGDNFWTGDIKPDESKSIEYKIKAVKAGKYTIPRLTVEYEDKRGKIYDKSAEAIEIKVSHNGGRRGEVVIPPKNAYGVIIGIGKYKDEDIPGLKYAKEDALEIYNILTDPKYGNFPKENVKLLLDEQATLTKIKSAMGTFLARNAGEDDMVCIYFAGHGSPELDPTGKADDNLKKFIVPYDAKKDDLFGYGLSMDTIREILDERIESKRAIFFIDSCYSGEAGGRTFSRPDVVARNITLSEKFIEQLSGEGRIIITASKPDELSHETDELKHGIFTYYLAEGLKGKADFNEDGVVTVDELYRYVYEQVTKKARQLGGKQHPLKKGTIVGEIPLTRCETERLSLNKRA